MRYESFIGQPVFLQLKTPLVLVQVSETQVLPHSECLTRQWIPTELRTESPRQDLPGELLTVDHVRYAVIRDVTGNMVEFSWLAPGATGPVEVCTTMHEEDIAFATRIVTPPPLPPEDPNPKLVTLG